MKPDIKEKWIKALESGEYIQGKSYLNNKGQYCCLGVLCELAVKAEVIPAGRQINTSSDGFVYGMSEDNAFLPSTVQMWAGLQAVDPYPSSSGLQAERTRYLPTLSSLNDEGKTFTEIAQIIKENM